MLRQIRLLVGEQWSRRGELANWATIARFRTSFLAKATTALSLTTFILSNFDKALSWLEVEPWRLRLIFLGALVFLIGYVIASLRSPPEFKVSADIDEIVSRMITVSDYRYFKSRRDMTQALVERMKQTCPSDLLPAYAAYAAERLDETVQVAAWDEREAATLYHADLMLRQFDRPRSRYAALLLLACGCAMLLAPSVGSVFGVIVGLSG